MRQVIVCPSPSGLWFAICPSLPGCVAEAHSQREALTTLKARIDDYVCRLKDKGPVPEARFESLIVAI